MIKVKVLPEEICRVRLIAEVIYAGGDIFAQTKAVTPSFFNQVIVPDDGYDYLSSVTVTEIPVTEEPNPYGETLTVGGSYVD